VKVELYTDASIVKGRGAWASLVLRGDGDPVEAFGVLRGSFRSSTATEIAAIANGIHAAHRAGLIERGDEVAIWCDNTAAVMWANGACRDKRNGDPFLREARRWIRDFSRRHGFKCRAAHVKGHQRLDSDDPRAIYNIRCDHLCGSVRDGIAPVAWASHVAKVESWRKRKAVRAAKEIA